MNTNHTDSVEAIVEDYLKQFPECPQDLVGCVLDQEDVNEFNKARLRGAKWLRTTLQATASQQVEEAVEEAKKEQRERDAYLVRTSGWHVAEKLARKIFGGAKVNWYTQKQLDGAVEEAVRKERERCEQAIKDEIAKYPSTHSGNERPIYYLNEALQAITPNHQD